MKPRVKTPVVSLRILPSAMTVAAICLGLTSVKFALDDRPTEAMAFLAVAAILDALDGRIARLLKAHVADGRGDRLARRRGELRCRTGIHRLRDAAVAFADRLDRGAAVRGVHRAAAGPVQRDARRRTKPAYTKEYFVGMPAPAGAIGAIGPLAAKMQFGDGWWTSEPAVVIWMIGVSLLVVSTDPDAQGPHVRGVAEHGGPAAGAAGDRRRRVDPVRLHRDPADHRRPT